MDILLQLSVCARTVHICQNCLYWPEMFLYARTVHIRHNSLYSAELHLLEVFVFNQICSYQKPRGRYVFKEDILYLPYRTNTENIVFMWCLRQSFTPALHPDVPPPA